jgi:hypothetical protein
MQQLGAAHPLVWRIFATGKILNQKQKCPPAEAGGHAMRLRSGHQNAWL